MRSGRTPGFIYHLYGFATIREMELQLEAGFHPLEVVQHATQRGAKALGLERAARADRQAAGRE